MAISTEMLRRHLAADQARAELGIRREPLEAVSSAWERLRAEYTPAELAEACRGWLRVGQGFADSPLAAVCRGVLAAAEQLEREG